MIINSLYGKPFKLKLYCLECGEEKLFTQEKSPGYSFFSEESKEYYRCKNHE